nr:hypothetical protein [Elizabethkingia sp. ASV34]
MRLNKKVNDQQLGQYIKTATLRIINEFIFQNTGSIRKHGNDEVQKLITKHNIQQVEQNKYS